MNAHDHSPRPVRRWELQLSLDQEKSQLERNKLGQFATPWDMACAVLDRGLAALPAGEPVRFFDPAFGLGAFYDALLHRVGDRPIEHAFAIEKDPHYGGPSAELWRGTNLVLKAGDFTEMRPTQEKFNLVVCNPPYVRHHHLNKANKVRLQALIQAQLGTPISGLAGLYCYFLLLSLMWMQDDGVGVWLIPSEFMDVNYGSAVRDALCSRVELLAIHRADPRDVQFDDALVSSAIVVFRNRRPTAGHAATFSLGGSLSQPRDASEIPLSALRTTKKWTPFPAALGATQRDGVPLGRLMTVRRGIATGSNKFFMRRLEDWATAGASREHLRPILPSPRYVPELEIARGPDGSAEVQRPLWLLDVSSSLAELSADAADLSATLRDAEATVGQGYLCRHRTLWYSQEQREPAPILCTYMGRIRKPEDGHPFRFILNHSDAIATNVYLLLYPRAELFGGESPGPDRLRPLWEHLNALDAEELTRAGRVYGGGLHKLEPAELGSVVIPQSVVDAIGATLPPSARGEQLPLIAR